MQIKRTEYIQDYDWYMADYKEIPMTGKDQEASSSQMMVFSTLCQLDITYLILSKFINTLKKLYASEGKVIHPIHPKVV